MASSYGTDADKGALRQGYLSARQALDPRAARAMGQAIIKNLCDFKIFAKAELVLTYVSQGNEVDTRTLIQQLLDEGRRVAVPRTDPKTHDLSFCEIRSLDELAPGFRGILEPAADAPVLDPKAFLGSVCLVPGLVFDAQGHRVGYGAGCYDRFLWHYTGDKIGLARTMQVSSNPLPIEAFDVPVDFLVTESSVWACR